MQDLPNLGLLDLSINSISSFQPLASSTGLQELNLFRTDLGSSQGKAGNGSSELDFLSKLTGLQALDLGNNQVRKLGPLSGLTALARLLLDSNLIADIAALVSNQGLGEMDQIDLGANQLTTDDCANLQTLKDRGATVFHDVTCP